MRARLHIAWTVSVVGVCLCAQAMAAPRVNCDAPHQRAANLEPVGSGPLKLAEVYCQTIRSTSYPGSVPVVSPDARSIAYYDPSTILRAGRLDGGATWVEYPGKLGTFLRFGSNIRSGAAFAWASDSRSIWTATHERVEPSGWAKTPMQPALAGLDGNMRSLSMLQHDAGPLDGLSWAGGEGLALAHFGTRGGFYRPEIRNEAPSFAIVDVRRGLVLGSLPFSAIETLNPKTQSPSYWVFVRDAAATVLSDGRVRALLSVGQWVVWTQGEAPRFLPDPYVAERNNRMAIASDGSGVLIGRLLQTDGTICTTLGGCTPGKPVEGVLAALHDLSDGRMLWSIRATVTNNYEFPAPAISADGRHALIGLVPTKDGPAVALVAMEDGRIVQSLPTPGGLYAMGFANGGWTVWTHAYGMTALYDLRPEAQ